MGCLKLTDRENVDRPNFLSVWRKNAASESCDNYYAFGLKFNPFNREHTATNKLKLFQGQEHVDDLGLNWDSFKWRNHQPDIGRFFNIDPLAEKYLYNSPYAFSENKVVAHIELEGLEAVKIEVSRETIKASVTPSGVVDTKIVIEHSAEGNNVSVEGPESKVISGTFNARILPPSPTRNFNLQAKPDAKTTKTATDQARKDMRKILQQAKQESNDKARGNSGLRIQKSGDGPNKSTEKGNAKTEKTALPDKTTIKTN